MKSLFGNAHILLTLAAFLWGGNADAGKLASADWQPFTITSVRWLMTAIVLLPFAWQYLKRDSATLRKHWHVLVLLGACGMAFFNLFMYLALNHTTAINVAIEQASMPVMVMLANFVLFSQRTSKLQLVGLALSILGVFVTTTAGRPWLFFTEGLNFGDAIMMLACVFYAGYTIGLRRKPNVHWLTFMWMISISAFAMTIPFVFWEIQQEPFVAPPLKGWAVMIYIILFPTICAQIFFARGVELIGGNRASQFINLVPIFGPMLAIVILNESFQWYHLAGLVLVIGGILLAERFAVNEK